MQALIQPIKEQSNQVLRLAESADLIVMAHHWLEYLISEKGGAKKEHLSATQIVAQSFCLDEQESPAGIKNLLLFFPSGHLEPPKRCVCAPKNVRIIVHRLNGACKWALIDDVSVTMNRLLDLWAEIWIMQHTLSRVNNTWDYNSSQMIPLLLYPIIYT